MSDNSFPPPSANLKWYKRKVVKLPVWLWIVGTFVAIGLIGQATNAPSEETTAPSEEIAVADSVLPTTVADTVPPTTVADTVPPTTVAPQTTVSSSPETTMNVNPLGGNSPEDFLMPNVLCMNLQEAQDEIQDHGVFFSRSQDASGQDRFQMNDSNWIVVDQSPSAGTRIGEGDAMLSVVKIGESTGGAC
jgi:hypothetical protein